MVRARLHSFGENSTEGYWRGQVLMLSSGAGRIPGCLDDASSPIHPHILLKTLFFFQFLKAGGRWEQLMEHCPLNYSGNRGSGAHNVIGTVLLSVLSGHWRYAHINSVRGDAINPPLLDMQHTVSEDTVRRAMKRIHVRRHLAMLTHG